MRRYENYSAGNMKFDTVELPSRDENAVDIDDFAVWFPHKERKRCEIHIQICVILSQKYPARTGIH